MEMNANEKDKQNLKENLEKQKKLNPTRFFKDNYDGSTSMTTKLPYVQIKMGNYTTTSDENGKFYLEGLEKGEYPLEVSFKGVVIYKSTIKIEDTNPSKAVDIVINRDESEFSKSFKKMEERHENAMKDENNETMSDTMADMSMVTTASADDGNIYFPTYKVGSVVEWSKSRLGTISIAQPVNIAKCNKAGDYTDDGTYDTHWFPLNSSDCAQAIFLGMDYSEDPITYADYSMNYYCWLEAINNDNSNSVPNIYCNGTYTMSNGESKGSHVNCSWFNGIGHTEVLHAHK